MSVPPNTAGSAKLPDWLNMKAVRPLKIISSHKKGNRIQGSDAED